MIQVFSFLDIINVHFSFLENGLGKNYQGFYIYYRFSYLKTTFLKNCNYKNRSSSPNLFVVFSVSLVSLFPKLQQRLQFPAELVESWIGKVSFKQGPAGPALPPGGKGNTRLGHTSNGA